jgi:hypothetical protein
MAGSDDTAEGQHVQRGSFLFHAGSSQSHVLDRGREGWHRIFLLCRGESFSPPEYLTEVFIEFARTLALRTAREETAILRLHVHAKNELILVASAKGTGFAV